MNMKLQFLGGVGNVTGSSHLVEVNDMRILIDCGFFQERDFQGRNWDPFAFDPASLDAVVLTHGHLDHCGLLPRLGREGFKGKVYATSATADIAEIVMRDAAHSRRVQGTQQAYGKFDYYSRVGHVYGWAYQASFTEQY